jgi:DNA-directed RNA polymerase specialized sigma24 family protein
MPTQTLISTMDHPDPIPPSPAAANPGPVSEWYVGAAAAAFDRLYTRAFAMALSSAQRRGLSHHDAEDVAATACDSLLGAFNASVLPPDPDDEVLAEWLEPRVHHRRLDWLRVVQRELIRVDRATQLEEGPAEPVTFTTDPDMSRLELRDAIVREVRGMTPSQQRVVKMVREGLAPDQIAEALGIANKSARMAVWRATSLLREALGPAWEKGFAKRESWYEARRLKRRKGAAQ